jgi:hypothetical protein
MQPLVLTRHQEWAFSQQAVARASSIKDQGLAKGLFGIRNAMNGNGDWKPRFLEERVEGRRTGNFDWSASTSNVVTISRANLINQASSEVPFGWRGGTNYNLFNEIKTNLSFPDSANGGVDDKLNNAVHIEVYLKLKIISIIHISNPCYFGFFHLSFSCHKECIG